MEKSRIPVISNEELDWLYSRIKPVIRYGIKFRKNGKIDPSEVDVDGLPFYIKDVDPREWAFTWGPKSTRQADDIERLDDIITYHTYGAPSLFKPSVAEVLAQIPEEYLEKTVAFEVRAENLREWNHVEEGGKYYHVTMTRLYQKKRRCRK